MPVQIACPKCSKRYSLPESTLGKTVKCKKCDTAFRTKKQTANKREVSQKPPNPTQPQSLDEFGISGGFQQEADIFNSPPPPPQAMAGFGNFAAEDPGFDESKIRSQAVVQSSEDEHQNPYQSVLDNPALRRKKAVSHGKIELNPKEIRKKYIEQETEIKQWGLVLLVLPIIGFLSNLLGFTLALSGEVESDGAVVDPKIVALVGGAIGLVFALVVCGLVFSVGWNLRRLNQFGRIGGLIFFGIGIIGFPVGTVASAIALRSLWNQDAKMICSPEYRDVCERTPEITHRSDTAAIFLTVAILFLVLIFALQFGAAIAFGE